VESDENFLKTDQHLVMLWAIKYLFVFLWNKGFRDFSLPGILALRS